MNAKLTTALALSAALLCSLNASARTLYVNASRPNNKGNGLKAATAFKTLQYAINKARNGDTILVYPGKYAPIKTNNKKITIKSVNGKDKTFILSGVDKKGDGIVIADLAAWSKNVDAYHRYWKEEWTICWKIGGHTRTTLQGFTVRPTSQTDAQGELWYLETAAAIAGGTAKNCAFEHCGGLWRYLAFESDGRSGKLECTAAWPTFLKTKLVGCRIFDCTGMGEWYKKNPSNPNSKAATPSSGILIEESTLARCTITQSGSSFSSSRNGGLPDTCNFRKSSFSNCLFARNWRPGFISCTLGNCTVAGNYGAKISSCTAYNTVFYKVANSQFAKKRKNKLVGCYRGASPGFVLLPRQLRWGADDENAFVGHETWNFDEASRLWIMADAVDADYHLAEGSPCIDKGTRKKAAKKLFGTKDLDGKKRIKGKAIDIGCYEY